jgi:hypothetical protein
MKRIVVSVVIAGFLVLASAVLSIHSPITKAATPVAAQRGGTCSYRSVEGKWGYSYFGITQDSGPIMSAGAFSLDNEGNFSGKETVDFGGSILDLTLSGSFTVNSDCTGSFTVNAFQDGALINTQTLDAVWVDNSNAIRMIPRDTDLDFIVDGKKMFPSGD